MKKYLKAIEESTENPAIMVTKKDVEEIAKQYPFIYIGNNNMECLKNFEDDDVVGAIINKSENTNVKNAELWFVDIAYFNEYNSIKTGEKDDKQSISNQYRSRIACNSWNYLLQ